MPTRPMARTDTSILARWWWRIDRWTLSAVMFLALLGIFMIFTASPSVAERIGLSSFYFLKRHLAYLTLGMVLLFMISMLSVQNIRRLSILIFAGGAALVVLTLVSGIEIKGARRWISLGGMSVQPSEFLKPAFAVLSAWMFTEKRLHPDFPGMAVAVGLYVLAVGLLLMQPDMGMVVLISAGWFAQLFLAGLSLIWVVLAGVFGVVGLGAAYLFLPHVHRRINQFLSGSDGDRFADQYQITQSLESFVNGGLLGRGPGEGVVKNHLPDSHADFIFAVAGEEFGVILCAGLVVIFMGIVLRNFYKAMQETNLFILLAVSGLTIQFGLQTLINIMSTLGMIPTKGMTLPFISFGGSSLLSICMLMGMMIGLTKERAYGESS